MLCHVLVMWHLNLHSFEKTNKGSWFGVCFVRTKRKPLGTREGIFCQACSAGATQSLSLSHTPSFLPHKGRDIQKDCTLVRVQQKLSAEFHPLLNLCLNNTRATNQNMLDTESEVMGYRSSWLPEKSPCVKDGNGWLLLWLMAIENWEGCSGPILPRLSPMPVPNPSFSSPQYISLNF